MAPREAAMYTDVYLDYLTCGKCALEFPLQNITDFISHKTSTCRHEEDDQSTHEPALSCFICLRDFRTARGVLYHVQFEHNLKIFTQKVSLSVERPFLNDDKQSSTAVPQDRNLAYPKVTTVTTTSSNRATTVMQICDPAVTSSRKSNLPVTCAKLASLEGATICCTGLACKVTFNPRKRVLKTCCTSVVPKKRDHHMKEHDSEEADLLHQEQSALETLATLRGRVLLSQKSGHKMETCQKSTSCEGTQSYCNSSQDAVWCNETGSCKKTGWQEKTGLCEKTLYTISGDTCNQSKTSESICEGGECEEASCDVDSVCDEDCGDVSATDNDYSRTACSEGSPCRRKIPQKMQIIRIDNEGITSKQTVIMKPGVTVTLGKKPACSVRNSSMTTDTCSIVDTCTRVHACRRNGTRERVNKQAECSSSHVYHPVDDSLQQSHSSSTAVDSSMDSAQILAEMMYHTVTNSPTPSVMSCRISNAMSTTAMAQPPLVNSVTTSSYAQPQMFLSEPSTSFENSSTSDPPAAVESNHNPLVHSAKGTVYNISSCKHEGANYPVSTAASGHPTVQPADNNLLDLDALTSSIRLFESLDQVSGGQQVSNVHPQSQERSCYNSSSRCGGSGGDEGIKMGEDLAKLTQFARKRRYPTSRPFKCTNCDQAFNQRIHLKKHMSKHTGVKPFKCEECEYSTVERSHLRAHIRIHTGEKPFCCPHCDYATAQNSTLKIHLKRHHNDCNSTL